MLKKLWVALLGLVAATAFAAVDVNKASQAELESIKGIGPSLSGKILDERRKAPFKDWNDVIERVKGVGGRGAARFSSDGLTVDGAAYTGTADRNGESKPRRKAGARPAAVTAPSKK